MTDIRISVAHNEARLNGTLQFMNAGAGPALIHIYGNTKPADLVDPAGASPLVTIVLAEPSGAVAGGVLTLDAGDDQLVMTSGSAQWGRCVNGDGETVFDCDVSDPDGEATIKIPNTTLFAGGTTRMISGVLG